MSALAVTSVTNFLLAAEALLFAARLDKIPKSRYSAAWYWTGMMLFLGLSALVGGIDHGFLEAANRPRYLVQRGDWLLISIATFCMLMSAATECLPEKAQRIVQVIGVVQFFASAAVILLRDSFLTVAFNYAPVLLFTLVLNLWKRRSGIGSRHMTVGLLTMAAASMIQVSGFDAFAPLDHNGLYHLVSMISVVFLYLAGKELTRAVNRD